MNKGDICPYGGVLVGPELYVEMLLKIAGTETGPL